VIFYATRALEKLKIVPSKSEILKATDLLAELRQVQPDSHYEQTVSVTKKKS
jgi:hypothetical protein